ncbi:class A sortase [Weissella paramesenteroides]|uniref:class A sortase n=1 Tax=Weissella paramesenteroides TaxID=1249 RepID=UPI002072F4D4|nr:class A sortase [Weissella paramesenteroides]MCM6767986.1 class A sortase [Weissella paramesenteroides]MCM6768747.1 class A sortase [Weissella paramesenteroides]MCM6770844.1 class A sortase [Weissella paramesenteroides]MCM6780765.1 class A sortase [Weissella paramesenteroides]
MQEIRSHRVVVDDNKKTSLVDRNRIRQRLMRETQTGLKKQGFVSIPVVGILEPIFNDAYSEKGLQAGANYANRSSVDPTGKQVPVMGQGNYGLASHNFDDGLTGFSGLQQNYQNDSPYLVNGQRQKSNWLNNQAIYLANSDGIFEYRIKQQRLVKADDVSVLDPSQKAQVTIITCLFPSTAYRITTIGQLKKSYTWAKAPDPIINYFDLTKQKTNAHVDWYNPGVEEGVNGDAGGTKTVK